MKNIGIILAGGAGQRMGTELPKQFLPLVGKTILEHSRNDDFQSINDCRVVKNGIRFYLLLLFTLFSLLPTKAQHSLGVTGLLNIPSADMQDDGTFMIGGNYLPTAITPEYWSYNTGNYFVNLTLLPFIEVGYRCTLINLGKYWNQDRSVSLRIRPLKENRWWPSLVLGSNDAFTTYQLNTFKESNRNRYFSSIYAVATKHWKMGGHNLGFTIGGSVLNKDNIGNSLFGGVKYQPSFYPQTSLMIEYDREAFNFGANIKLFNHLTVHLFCYDLKAISGGLRYELKLFNL